jgi:putative oxidoreductase
VLRLAVGAVFIAHGGQKLFGLWGGNGLGQTAAFLTTLGLTPAYPLAILLAVTEFFGGVLLVLGWWARWAALALAIDMGVALYRVHLLNGFFLNWNITPGHGHGIEYNVALIGALLSIALTGAGALSVDEWRNQSAEAEARGRARARTV